MTAARDNRKKNDRLDFSIRRNPAVAVFYPDRVEALRLIDESKAQQVPS